MKGPWKWIVASSALTATAVLATVLARPPEPGPPPGPASAEQIAGLEQLDAAPRGPSWAPRPRRVGGLSVTARAAGGRLTVHTAHGTVDFLAGVNLGSTTPGHQPGELSLGEAEYRAWFPAMRRLGVRVLRIYTIHPPVFYTELARYNRAHPDGPLYLMHGVYLPDESYVTGGNLYDRNVTGAFRRELVDAVAAAHGQLRRAPQRGRASGTWSADVSPWLVGWVIGAEWDPGATADSDRRNAAAPRTTGRYFSAAAGATPTERWLAARMDELATAQAARGWSAPVAFVNWPSTDPLRHPDEPQRGEDLVGVDPNRIITHATWPAGQFASYHAYPYFPDFLRHEAGLSRHRYQGRPDPYAGYLRALKAHHARAGIPVVITELGVPSSLGSAHGGPLGRDQGDHAEQDAMRITADLLLLVKDAGLSGAVLFSWIDEWFKLTWNTVARQLPADRRQLWHDALTNEQWFGLVATDPTGQLNPDPQRIAGRDGIAAVTARVDEAYLHLDVEFRAPPSGTVAVGLDPVAGLTGTAAPGGSDTNADVALVFDPARRRGRLWIRQELDPVRLDPAIPEPVRAGAVPGSAAPGGGVDGWLPLRLVTNRQLTLPASGRRLPAEFHDPSELRCGGWEPGEAGYDSRSTWRVDGGRLRIRLPWAMAGLSDPSSHRVLLPSATGHTTGVDTLGLSVTADGRTTAVQPVAWNGWNRVGYQARLKAGAGHVRDAFAALYP